MSWVITGLGVGLFLGGFMQQWFEDVLRGPIMRAYDDAIYGDGAGLPHWIGSPPADRVVYLEE